MARRRYVNPIEPQCTRWARDVGLDVSKKADAWSVRAHVETHGELPRAVWSGKTPRFFLAVTSSCWFLELMIKDAKFSYGKVGGEKGAPGSKSLKVPSPKTLATLRSWLTEAEKKTGVTFCRDRPLIESNLKGGARAMELWIRDGG